MYALARWLDVYVQILHLYMGWPDCWRVLGWFCNLRLGLLVSLGVSNSAGLWRLLGCEYDEGWIIANVDP